MFVQDEIEHDGKYIKIPKRPIHPKPFQDPHPPMYMACTNNDGLLRAGQRGLGALVLGFGGPDEVAKKNAIYREAWATRKAEDQVGFRPTQHLAALCPTVVMSDGQQARKIGIRGQRYFMESLAYWYTGGERPNPDSWGDDLVKGNTGEMVIRSRFASEEVVVDFSDPALSMMNPNHAYGTVDDCIGYVGRLMEAGVDEVLFLCQMGTVPQEAQLETIRNIGEHVIPYFNRLKAEKQKAEVAA
jgi:alkanesulfonate monooxygenase SsuD/methylene tetrahydromethanopterin reductase-like flavin-dependent oxidoreductase (luciferase family)